MAKILVIDDEEDYRNLVKVILEPAGHQVDQATDGEAGLSMLSQKKPDLVVLDINMPGKDGYEVCETIRTSDEWNSVPILMLTVRRLDAEQVRGLNAGADDYLTKPFQPEELIGRVQSLLRRSKSEETIP